MAAAVGQHVLAGDGVGQEHAVQVHVDDLAPLGVGHLVRGGVDADAGVGVAEVQAAQLGDDLVHHLLDVFFTGDVALQGDDLAAGGLGDLLRGRHGGLVVQVHDGDIRACLSEGGGGALADAAGGAGDEALLAVQTHAFNDSHDTASLCNDRL